MIFMIGPTSQKMAFSSLQFYSSTIKSSRALNESRLNADKLKHDQSLVKTERPTGRLLETPPAFCELRFPFKVFCRQQQAIEFAKTCAIPKKVFSYELPSFGSQGQRRYLAESVFDFGRAYVSMTSNRHVYEVITEGATCKLYFDVEFKLKCNPGVIGVEVLEVFVQYVCYLVGSCFGLAVNRTHVLDLDSSSEVKFSRHLIFHLPGAVFQNNKQVGNFVRHACDQLRALKESASVDSDVSQSVHKTLFPPCTAVRGLECPSAPQLLGLFLMDERGSPVLLCDESVYSRNRNFRLYLSSKLGKGIPLRVAKENKFKSQYVVGRGQTGSRQFDRHFNLLVDSLVTHVRYVHECHVLTFDDIASGPKRRKMSLCGSVKVLSPPAEGFTRSPYPLVDQFVISQWTRGGVEPSIRKWTLFPHAECLVFEIANSRWCENVGRQHKSNHVMIVVDLAGSVFYQKCHDPECRRVDFKSKEYHIPAHINPLSNKALPANQNIDVDLFENDEFLQALSNSMDRLAEEDDDDVWLKAFEVVEQDPSLGQPSAISEVDRLGQPSAISEVDRLGQPSAISEVDSLGQPSAISEVDSLGQPSAISEVDSLVCVGVPGHSEGMEDRGAGARGSIEQQSLAGRLTCEQTNGPLATDDLLMTEEEMRLFLCE